MSKYLHDWQSQKYKILIKTVFKAGGSYRDDRTSSSNSREDGWLSASAAISWPTKLMSSSHRRIKVTCFSWLLSVADEAHSDSSARLALRSQLLCSSWCHLNLFPAGLYGVDKNPSNPATSDALQKKNKKNSEKWGYSYEDGLPSWWHWFTFQ